MRGKKMTDNHETQTRSAKSAIAELQRRWILEGWEKQPGEEFVFTKKVGEFYDWDNAHSTMHDTFDPQYRLARSPQEWSDAFEAPFQSMTSALHAVTDEPDVMVAGDFAASTFEFCARLEGGDGTLTGTICRTSHVWGLREGTWKIIREHTSCRLVPIEEVHELLRRFEPQKVK
jgi:ketosteroid isomerase-like protein